MELPHARGVDEKLRELFKKFDVNGDGLLSRNELKAAFAYLGVFIPGFKAKRGMHHADKNHDGYVDEHELNALVMYATQCGYKVK